MRQTRTENPFRPGFGRKPEVFVGRTHELRGFENFISELTGGVPPNDATIVGPRGNGKTTLMSRYRDMLASAKVSFAEVVGSDVDGMAKLLNAVERQLKGKPTRVLVDRDEVVERKVSMLKLFSWSRRREARTLAPHDEDAVSALEEHLKALTTNGRRPFALLVDEAHESSSDTLETLANASQNLKKAGIPMQLILAGTPVLDVVVRKAGATFANRCEKLRLGLLTESESRSLLVDTAAIAHIVVKDEVLNDVVDACQGHSHFLQYAGKELTEACFKHEVLTAGREEWNRAYPLFVRERTLLYGTQLDELEEKGLLEGAVAIADTVAKGGATSRWKMKALLLGAGIPASKALDALDEISHTGLAWKQNGVDYVAGIPSLATFVREHGGKAVNSEEQA